MAVSSPALREALADIVGSEDLIDAARALDAHAVDGVRPSFIARPRGVEDVSRLVALAHAEHLTVSPRGSGSALSLGNPPRALDLIVDLRRLDAVTDYVPEDMVASAEAGVSLAALGRRLGDQRQMLALDPIGGSSRSIGGVLATNASGPLRFRYGTARDLTLGVRFVQADGTITWGGAKVVKSVTGYDVPKLMVGSLGTLGIIVGATVRLHPHPSARGSWLIVWHTREAAESFLAALMASSVEPDRVTFLNGEASRAFGRSGGEPALLLSIGSVREAVSSQGDAIGRLVTTHGGDIHEAPDSCWDRLESVLNGTVLLRLACEPKRVVFWVEEMERLGRALGLRVATVAQAGNGVMHAALEGEALGAALDGGLLQPIREGLGPEAGSVIVERAPAALKANLDVWGPVGADALAIMSRLKTEFDPEGTLNPGRFIGGL
jgi:glycolate oxidase FAD binding subunit